MPRSGQVRESIIAIFQPPPTWAEPVLVDERSKKAAFNPIWLKWFVDLISVINTSGGGGGTIQHNTLLGLQGGAANQFYHLDATHYTFVNALTATATQINQLGSGLSVTITTAKLTGIGANGSMTFTNGVLTAQTPAT